MGREAVERSMGRAGAATTVLGTGCGNSILGATWVLVSCWGISWSCVPDSSILSVALLEPAVLILGAPAAAAASLGGLVWLRATRMTGGVMGISAWPAKVPHEPGPGLRSRLLRGVFTASRSGWSAAVLERSLLFLAGRILLDRLRSAKRS